MSEFYLGFVAGFGTGVGVSVAVYLLTMWVRFRR